MPPMPDFSKPRQAPFQFTIDDDTFEAVAVLPADGTRALIAMTAEDGGELATSIRRIEKMGEFLDVCLLPASAARFAERMKSPTDPIDDEQIGQVCVWLMEQYGHRPTVPPTPSDGGRLPDGAPSTDGAQPPALV